jgi:CPA2 family monovalent cation:H+ antiporter-2
MKLDVTLAYANLPWVVIALVTLIVAKTFLIYRLSGLFGSDADAALRTGLDLAQGCEFGFVLLSLAAPLELMPVTPLQTVLAAMVLVDARHAVHHRAQRAHRAGRQPCGLDGPSDGTA